MTAADLPRAGIDRDHPLLLGSASPRRREILSTLGVPLLVAAADADERTRDGELPLAYVARVGRAKLEAVTRMARSPSRALGGILTADTTVVLDDRALGKPEDVAHAEAMIASLSGRAHDVATHFALADGEGGFLHEETVVTRVVFRELDRAEIAGYARTGEGADKAGGYALQGIGSFMVARIEGSYTNVVGLPACEVIAALRKTGLLARFPLL